MAYLSRMERNSSDKLRNMYYHYTSFETFLKILQDIQKEKSCISLRASRIDKVNDPNEMILTKKRFLSITNQYEKTHNDKRIPSNAIEQIEDEELNSLLKKEKEEHPPYIVCFSKERDYLPMWSLYGDKHHGVCICFSEDIVEAIRQKNIDEIILDGDIAYTNYMKSPVIQKIYDLYLNLIIDKVSEQNIKEEIVNLLVSLTPFIKSKHYKYEKEYRICIHNYIKEKTRDIKYDKESEYLNLEIPLNSIHSVILGSKLPFDISKEILSNYLNQFECNIKIEHSQIPFI